MKNFVRVLGSAVALTAGLGLAGLGAAAVAHAQPAPFPDYHWCPGEYWDPGWGDNWDPDRCHDDHWLDGDPHDLSHWHGPEGYPGGPGVPGSPGVGPW
ncbi:hypothetical protein H7K24_17645 [Mycobacterium fragae]|uniref:Pilin n=1 Tax=Mycobacterium fragae TaxID=1260918 RepID=A0A1X1URA9_9MYCO|nr:hypothetical protein [Mycobacterium fragae]MCV7401969.1 hypothetical protein [Mycobacterium fragae]ORV59218.1 hypothetical protein AWC06_17785 [Mycobacterium fragae]